MSSLVTRCPACGTLFKVVPDQLRISEGWVRCGQCDEVFDAQAHMQPPMALAPEAATHQKPSEELSQPFPGESANASDPPPEEPAAAPDIAPPPSPDELSLPVQERAASTEDWASGEPPEGADLPSEPSVLTGGPDEEPALDSLPPDGDGWVDATPEWAEQERAARSEVTDTDVKPRPSFLQTATPRRDSRAIGFIRSVAVGGLALLLLGQVMLQQRERLAASAPSLVPVLEVLCVWRGCEVGPLRQIESVVIESSSFVKVKADVYRLSFSIKNTAPVPVALPYAELTLTDLRDQSVLRRVVAPSDYGARAVSLAPGEELGLVVPVAVKAASGVADKVTGYRLLVFYP